MSWTQPGDRSAVHQRLAGGPDTTSGADKGRVLYVVERRPLRGGRRIAAAALTTVDARTIRLFRLCFSAETLRDQRMLDATLLVSCTRALAKAGRRALRMLVPPNAPPGDVAAQFGFVGGTERDRYGQVWLR